MRISVTINNTLTDTTVITLLTTFKVSLMNPLIISVIIFKVHTARNNIKKALACFIFRKQICSNKKRVYGGYR